VLLKSTEWEKGKKKWKGSDHEQYALHVALSRVTMVTKKKESAPKKLSQKVGDRNSAKFQEGKKTEESGNIKLFQEHIRGYHDHH